MILHDLMSPLTAIQVGVESVLERMKAGEATAPVHQRLLKNAHEACQKLMDMFRDILSVSRLEENRLPLNRVWVEATEVTREALATFDNERRLSGISVDVRMDAGLPRLYCDRDITIRVLSNLIANSLKFTPPGGSVSIAVRTGRAEGFVEFSVEDPGVGILPGDLEKIFDKFYQARREGGERKGFGLGLAFCKLAVEAHGGRIWAESRLGAGSRFIFLLPAE
jgi:signal transduction histidine kinase